MTSVSPQIRTSSVQSALMEALGSSTFGTRPFGRCHHVCISNLEHSTVLYETENSLPLLRIAWNKQDPNCVAVIAMDQNYITLLDMRSIPSEALDEFILDTL